MTYSRSATITIPASMVDLGNRIARALDPDTGGDQTFSDDRLTVSTPCTEGFAQSVQAMIDNPALLYPAVSADYAARWPDEFSPTEAECAEFMQGALCSVG